MAGMAQWWSIEVFSSDKLPAASWRYAYEDELTEAAITNGALYYEWHDTGYGVIFEVLFRDDDAWDGFRWLPAVRAALDGVPDPVNGLLVYRGRGGAAGGRQPRKPKPSPGAASAELEEPRRRVIARALGVRREAADEALREPGGPEPLVPDPAGTEPITPDQADAGRGEPVWRDIAAFDRSAG